MCPKDYIIEQLKIQKEKQRQRIEKEREEALAQIQKIENEKKSSAERKIVKEQYRQIVIKLSEEDSLLEEILNAEKIESLNTQYCPKCHVRIEKNGGCSHMHCSRCDYDFTWRTIPQSQNSKNTLLLNNSTEIESVKEELNKTVNIGLEEII
jgi:NADH pyrophosphatase NudC (nudix superfamily)